MVGDSLEDPDGDWISNISEYVAMTDPCVMNDTDGDGMPDGWESFYQFCGLEPFMGDSLGDADSDGLLNLAEYTEGTDPCLSDTDGDSVTDGDEVNTYLSDPLDPNTDGDDWDDGEEVNVFGTDPNSPDIDTDTDGLPDAVETNTGTFVDTTDTGTDPSDPDTDADGVNDGYEVLNGSHPLSDRVTPGALKIGSDVRVTSAANESFYPSLSWTGSEFGVGWGDWRDGYKEIYFARISSDGAKIGFDLRVTNDASYTHWPSICWNGSEFGLIWGDEPTGVTELYFTRISASGSKIGADIRETFMGYYSRYPHMVWTGSEYGVNWLYYQSGNSETYFARLSENGTKLGSDLRVTYAADPLEVGNWGTLAWTGSEFGLAWEDNRYGAPYNFQIYFTRISAAGEEIGDDVRITNTSGNGGSNNLAWTGSEFGLSWYDDRDGNREIYFLRLSSSGG
jgi:hypothetical protein